MENLPEENLIKEQIQNAPQVKKPFPKLLIVLGASLLLIVALFIVFTVLRNQKIKELATTSTTTLPTGAISFDATDIILDSKKSGSVDISISTGGNQIGGVVLAIKYNPTLLKDVKIENIKDPNSAISQLLTPVGKLE